MKRQDTACRKSQPGRELDQFDAESIDCATFAARRLGRRLDGAAVAMPDGCRLFRGLVVLHYARRINVTNLIWRRQRDASIVAQFQVSRPQLRRVG
jgi:hypothetical protein